MNVSANPTPGHNLKSDIPAHELTSSFRWPIVLVVCLMFVGTGALVSFAMSPKENGDILVELPVGVGGREIASILHDKGVVRSPVLFMLVMRYLGKENSIQAGYYLFPMPLNVYSVAKRVSETERGIESVKITIPEGWTNKQIEELVRSKFSDASVFSTAGGLDKEGYLFPDTYFFYSIATSGEIMTRMRENFDARTAALREEAATAKRSWHDVVVMASIIEKEANTDIDRPIVSGILWKRIALGMPLQVDATLFYLLGKTSSELTSDDLNIDSPYNTYRRKGLPPEAIGNPGLKALDAAVHPEKVPYLYYLSDNDGVMHYAKTFEEHKLNKAKYLR